ncbi:hypothetical protein ADL03_15320 [Nocardia sp. NRRL S-836]|nr:hypothetical protein ADL03_15320 [Nocardia sp. NRRL S-836]
MLLPAGGVRCGLVGELGEFLFAGVVLLDVPRIPAQVPVGVEDPDPAVAGLPVPHALVAAQARCRLQRFEAERRQFEVLAALREFDAR